MRQKTGKFFEVVVAYEKATEDGLVKKVKETVVVEADSCGEAETRSLEEIASYCAGDMECVKIALASYKEVLFADEGDVFYKVKVNLITIDEVSAKEKKTAIFYLTSASSIDGARRNIVSSYEGSVMDYDICLLQETKITEVYEKQ